MGHYRDYPLPPGLTIIQINTFLFVKKPWNLPAKLKARQHHGLTTLLDDEV